MVVYTCNSKKVDADMNEMMQPATSASFQFHLSLWPLQSKLYFEERTSFL